MLSSTFVSWVSPDAALLVIRNLYNISKTLSPSLWQWCINTLPSRALVSTVARFTLTCHGTGARLSLMAMTPFPGKNNSGLTNPHWRMYIDFLKKDSIDV